MNLNIVIVANSLNQFDLLKKNLISANIIPQRFIWCDMRSQSRAMIINQNIGGCLLFLDADCMLDRLLYNELIEYIKLPDNIQKKFVICGLYKNPNKSKYLQRAHNFVANTWLESSFIDANSSANRFLLGGAFLVNAIESINIEHEEIFWGGEDKILSLRLKEKEYLFILNKNFQVEHATSCLFSHFFHRAIMQGKNEILVPSMPKARINYQFWFRKIGFANLPLLPLILFHFCIQKTAQMFQKIHQVRTLKKLN